MDACRGMHRGEHENKSGGCGTKVSWMHVVGCIVGNMKPSLEVVEQRFRGYTSWITSWVHVSLICTCTLDIYIDIIS